MGVLVMPAAVMGLVVAPLGLEMGPALDHGCRSALDFGGGPDNRRDRWVRRAMCQLPVHGCCRCSRLGSVAIALAGAHALLPGSLPSSPRLLLWYGANRPAVLISDTGSLVGVMTPSGRAPQQARKARGFVALKLARE